MYIPCPDLEYVAVEEEDHHDGSKNHDEDGVDHQQTESNACTRKATIIAKCYNKRCETSSSSIVAKAYAPCALYRIRFCFK